MFKRYAVVEEGGGGLDFEVDLDRGRGWVLWKSGMGFSGWWWGWGCGVLAWEVDVGGGARGFDGGANLRGGGEGWVEFIVVGLGGGGGGVGGGGGFHPLVLGWVE